MINFALANNVFSASPDCAAQFFRTLDFRTFRLWTFRKLRRAIPRESFPAAKCAAAKPSNPKPWIRFQLAIGRRPRSSGIFPPSCWRTCSAIRRRNLVGQIRARRGERKTAFANHRLNERMAWPADADGFATSRDNLWNFFARGKTSVSGPGQNDFASLSASSGQFCTQPFAISLPATWTMMGLFAGRPLIWKIFATAWVSAHLRRGRKPFPSAARRLHRREEIPPRFSDAAEKTALR
jgi:hypothetical protein